MKAALIYGEFYLFRGHFDIICGSKLIVIISFPVPVNHPSRVFLARYTRQELRSVEQSFIQSEVVAYPHNICATIASIYLAMPVIIVGYRFTTG